MGAPHVPIVTIDGFGSTAPRGASSAMPLTEALLRAVGLGVWAFVGGPTLWGFLTQPERLTSARGIL